MSTIQPEALRLADVLDLAKLIDYYNDVQRDLNDAAAELRRLHAQVAALTQPAQVSAVESNTAYAALPEPCNSNRSSGRAGYGAISNEPHFNEIQLRDFADRTHAIRVSHGQAPAGATVRHLEAVIKGAADKLDAAVRCHPNAVDTLIHEALEILDGDREPYCTPTPQAAQQAPAGATYTYSSTQATKCAACGEHKHTPLRIDAMGGYVCLTCIDQKLGGLLGEFGYEQTDSVVQQVEGGDAGLEAAAQLLESQHTWITNVAAANLVRSLAARAEQKEGDTT